MSLLGGDAAALFGELLSGRFVAATLTSVTTAYDGQGNLTRRSAPTPCRVQIDRATERMVASEGYTLTDQALYVLAAPGGALPAITQLDSDSEIVVVEGPYSGQTYRIATPIDRDPAAAYWLCRGVLKDG